MRDGLLPHERGAIEVIKQKPFRFLCRWMHAPATVAHMTVARPKRREDGFPNEKSF